MAISCCTAALPFLNQQLQKLRTGRINSSPVLYANRTVKGCGKYEAKQGNLLPLQTRTAGWSSSQGTPPLTQQVPSLMYTCNPWSYLRYIFVASVAMGSLALFLFLDEEQQQRSCILEVCHSSPVLHQGQHSPCNYHLLPA